MGMNLPDCTSYQRPEDLRCTKYQERMNPLNSKSIQTNAMNMKRAQSPTTLLMSTEGDATPTLQAWKRREASACGGILQIAISFEPNSSKTAFYSSKSMLKRLSELLEYETSATLPQSRSLPCGGGSFGPMRASPCG